MAFRTLDINVISAKGLKNVNLIDKMDVYAVVSLKGDSSKQKLKTPVHKDCGKNPNWNFPVKFTVDESLAKNNKLSIKFKIMCERILGDKELGVVNVPVKELLDSPGDGGSMKFVSFQVRKPSGKPEGTLDFSYKFGDKVLEPVGKNKGDDHPHHQPVTAYPAAHVAAGSSSAGPPPPGYGYPPPPPGYAYPPPPAGAYGYPPVQQPPKKNSKFGLGLGAGLVGGAIGGMLIGDMVSDAADYDGGFDF
ncbi:hypothetical protein Godav_016583 [Gossypium davidsonii]|uniref:C2 domain-containing protein n=1 Tax=Gossypium davidsonii TaxID=34287 RepID=A0A7J8RRW3_GOSDV|nr:hypothetical protein [Gossypium davidsonii]